MEPMTRIQRRDSWLSLFTHDLEQFHQQSGTGAGHPEPQLEAMIRHYGLFWNEHVAPFFAEIYAETGLDRKTVELIGCALLAARGWDTGVRAHAALALEAGATPDEVRGAILMTMGVGGITAAATGLAWAEPVLAAVESSVEK